MFPLYESSSSATSPKLYQLHPVDVIKTEAAEVAAVDVSYFGCRIRTNDPRCGRRNSSSEQHDGVQDRGIVLTTFTRTIPLSANDVVETSTNGNAFRNDQSDRDDTRAIAETLPAPPPPRESVDESGCNQTGSSIVAARHLMHHSVSWMSSTRSAVQQKSPAVVDSSLK